MGRGVEWGGPTAWRVFTKGDLVCAMHWVEDEPALVLFPAKGRMLLNKCVPYCLPLSAAHELVKDGSKGFVVDSEVLWVKASRAAYVMGYGNDFQIARQAADLILNHLDDLCDMPPKPTLLIEADSVAPTGELAVKVAGETIFHGEV
jgi:hypothetical protein